MKDRIKIMQKVYDAKGRLIAFINEDRTIIILGNNCKTTINLFGNKPIIKSVVNYKKEVN